MYLIFTKVNKDHLRKAINFLMIDAWVRRMYSINIISNSKPVNTKFILIDNFNERIKNDKIEKITINLVFLF